MAKVARCGNVLLGPLSLHSFTSFIRTTMPTINTNNIDGDYKQYTIVAKNAVALRIQAVNSLHRDIKIECVSELKNAISE